MPDCGRCWTGPNGEELETAAVVTTDANRALGHIHARMPVVIAPDAFDLWLNCAEVDAETAAALIAPAPGDLLEAYPVSTDVNRVANDNAKLLEPVAAGAARAATGAQAPARAPKRAKKDDGPDLAVLSGNLFWPTGIQSGIQWRGTRKRTHAGDARETGRGRKAR